MKVRPTGGTPHFFCKDIIPGCLFRRFCKDLILGYLASGVFREQHSPNSQILRGFLHNAIRSAKSVRRSSGISCKSIISRMLALRCTRVSFQGVYLYSPARAVLRRGRDASTMLPSSGDSLRKSPRVKPTHGAPTTMLLERQFVIWSTRIYILSRESIWRSRRRGMDQFEF